jgi:hypothetical protein
MTMPLDGVRVIDWTIWQQGPVCSLMLGDLGADVIKVEERVGGDPGRGVLRAQGIDLSDRPNFYFEANNRNKRSITVDLKKPDGVDIVRKLADGADVFVQNFRYGVAARLGLDAQTLRARNPRLVYASARGPLVRARRSSFDTSGLGVQCGGRGRRRSARASRAHRRSMGTLCSYGVLGAFSREGDGRPGVAALGFDSVAQGLGSRASPPRARATGHRVPALGATQCADGEWIRYAPGALTGRKLCSRQLPDAGRDERFTVIDRMMNAGDCVSTHVLSEPAGRGSILQGRRLHRLGPGLVISCDDVRCRHLHPREHLRPTGRPACRSDSARRRARCAAPRPSSDSTPRRS